jgi:hypothetical protein
MSDKEREGPFRRLFSACIRGTAALLRWIAGRSGEKPKDG